MMMNDSLEEPIRNQHQSCNRYRYCVTVLCLVLSIVCYSVCFMFGFEYRLILSMFYVWFRVSFDTQYVLCLVSSYRLILEVFYVTFQGWPFRQPHGYCLQGTGQPDKCI